MSARAKKTRTSGGSIRPLAGLPWTDIGRGAAVVALCALLFFSGLGLRSLWETDEARYGEIAREMVTSGDLVTPTLNYVKYFEKPPLTYWLTALSFKAFGISDASARYTPALFGLLTVLVVFLLGRSMWDGRAGFFAALTLATSLMFFALSRILMTDMVLCFGIVLAFYGAWELYRQRSWGLYLFWLGCAVGFLSKGLLGPGMPAVAVFIFAALSGEWDLLKRLLNWRGILLFVLLCAPWVIWVSLVNPDFFHFFFIEQHLGRLLTNRYQRSEPIYFYLWLVPAALFPWVAALPWAVGNTWPGAGWRTPGRRPWLFAVCWFVFFFLLLSASRSKMLHYALPMLPALALLLGRALGQLFAGGIKGEAPPALRWSLAGLAVLCLAGGLAFVVVPAGNPDISFGQVGAFLLIGPALAAAAGVAVFALRRRLVMVLAAPLGLFLLIAAVAGLAAPRLDAYRSVEGLVAPLRGELRPGDVLASYGDYYQGMPFYSGRRVVVVRNWGELDFGRRRARDAARWFLPGDGEFIRLLQNPRTRVIALAETGHYRDLMRKVKGKPGLLLFSWGTLGDKTLFSNRPRP